MPSTRVPLRITSASISIALKLAAVSVVKKGFPVPAPKITTLPFSKWRTAFLLMKGSAISFISIAVCNRVSTLMASKAACNAMLLITVANIPI